MYINKNAFRSVVSLLLQGRFPAIVAKMTKLNPLMKNWGLSFLELTSDGTNTQNATSFLHAKRLKMIGK